MTDHSFVRTTLAGAMFVLLPLALAVLLIGKVGRVLRELSETVIERLPTAGFDHLPLALILTIVALVLLCYGLGLLLAPRSDVAEGSWLDRKVLHRIPGYQILRGMALGFFGFEGAKTVKIALLRREENVAELVIVVEAVDDHRSVVFVPESPAPMTGTVLVVENELLELLPVTAVQTLQIFTRWGAGVRDLVKSGDARA